MSVYGASGANILKISAIQHATKSRTSADLCLMKHSDANHKDSGLYLSDESCSMLCKAFAISCKKMSLEDKVNNINQRSFLPLSETNTGLDDEVCILRHNDLVKIVNNSDNQHRTKHISVIFTCKSH